MMFQLDTAFATELIALVLGAGLLVLASKWEVKCKFTKFVGVFVIVTSFLGMICTGYYGIRYSIQGYFAYPTMKMGLPHVMNREDCPMMEMEKKMKMDSETKP